MLDAATSSAASPFRTRLNVLFASAAAVAVVLRTGPKRHHQLLRWDLSDDTFTPGQWMKGLVRLMDLSPRGDKLIYWAAQYHAGASRSWPRPPYSAEHSGDYDPLQAGRRTIDRARAKRPDRRVPRYLAHSTSRPAARQNQGVWTAVSTPPWFTALAIWPCIGHWTGGGYFISERHIVLFERNDGFTPIANVPVPTGVLVSSMDDPALSGIPFASIAVDPLRQPIDAHSAVSAALACAGVRYVEWVHISHNGDLLFACDGAIYRLRRWNGLTDGDLRARATRLVDLTAATFQLVRPPCEAMRW